MNDDFLEQISISPMETAADYYSTCISSKALTFLEKQCLCADASLRVGFSDRTIGKRIPSNQRKRGREIRRLLQDAGILKATGHETFRGHVTVPLTDIEGQVTGIYGMRLDWHGSCAPVARIGRGVFNAQALRSYEEIIVCDDPLNAWTFYASGHKNVIAAENQPLARESLSGVKRVLLVHPAIDREPFDGLQILEIKFPESVSVHQYARNNRSPIDALGARIRAASWISGAPQEEPREPQSPAASPVPPPADEFPVQAGESEVTIQLEHRRWRIRGLERNKTLGVMKVNVMVFHEPTERFHVDTLDLYHARSRRVFLKDASEEIGASENELRSDLGRLLLKLEQLQMDLHRRGQNNLPTVQMTDADRREALDLLTDERLLDRILEDFDACGIVGERIGKLTGYLAATSRLLSKPLGIVIQSSSAAGKTSIMDAILSMMPPEQQFACSAITSQCLYYAGNLDLRHRIMSIAEEEGVRDASYALKLLQSEGKLSIVTTAKESGSGRTAVERYDVEGPVTLLLTTTASDVDPELMNRCFVLNIDEDVKQTEAIQARQRHAETFQQVVGAERADQIRKLHQNAQRLLKPIRIVNRYAEQLTFAKSRVRNRRDNAKYLSLISAVTLLHQYQREIKYATFQGKSIEYIDVERDDIATANMIASAVLGSCIDELPASTRRLLRQTFNHVYAIAERTDQPIGGIRFTRRELRDELHWGQTQLKVHLDRLAAYEYVHVYPGPGRTLLYELRWDGRDDDGQRTLFGLTDPSTLKEPPPTTDASSAAGG